MRLLKGTYTNFASYESLEFDYSNQGLTLVSGPTGAGKSTLMDAAFWCLFGQTSKEGSVDEVKTWGGSTATTGRQEVELPDTVITVFRIRGKATQNDLYWVEGSHLDQQIRGKDVTETQKLLEKRLGVSAELYFISAYMHQFSRADSFFVAKAKERRDLFERIADLTLPVRISEGASDSRKTANSGLSAARTDYARIDGQLSGFAESKASMERGFDTWEKDHKQRCQDLEKKVQNFEAEKEAQLEKLAEKIKKLDSEIQPAEKFINAVELINTTLKKLEKIRDERDGVRVELNADEVILRHLNSEYKKFSSLTSAVCPTCLGNTNNGNKEKHLNELKGSISACISRVTHNKKEFDELDSQVKRIAQLQSDRDSIQRNSAKNDSLISELEFEGEKYTRLLELENHHKTELAKEVSAINPYQDQLEELEKKVQTAAQASCALSLTVGNLEERVAHLTQVYDLSFKLRGELLQNVVQTIEGTTNNYLEKYFDGAIRVSFTLDGDKLEVEIQKDGNVCSFKQLSGGQRCMLKLAFSVSLMKAASDKAGVHFGTLFFDESLNGLDSDLKVKAFSLFQELENDHESVILIDHAEEFKSLFSNQYLVSLSGTGSTLEKVSSD